MLADSWTNRGRRRADRIASGAVRQQLLLAVIAIIAALSIGFVAVAIEESLATTSLGRLLLWPALLLAIVPIVSGLRLIHGDWFHPLALPLMYVAFALLVPLAYVLATHRALPTLAVSQVSIMLVAALSLTVVGMGAGICGSLALFRNGSHPDRRRLAQERLLMYGRIALTMAVVLRAYRFATEFGHPYGYDSVQFGFTTSLQNAADALFLVAVILVSTTNARMTGRLLKRRDALAVVAFVLLTLGVGKRGVLIAPVLFLAWAYHAYIRRLSFGRALAGLLVVAVVFQGVLAERANQSVFNGGRTAIERTLGSVATPAQVTALVISSVPSQAAFFNGSTYIADLVRQLPGPIAVAAFGPPKTTGAFALRSLLNLNTPNFGYSFALPAEGYLNFGMYGVVGAALLVGLLLGFAYRRMDTNPTRAIHLLYPILLCTLPLSLRTDGLGEVKTVLYPTLILALVYKVCRIPATAEVSVGSGSRPGPGAVLGPGSSAIRPSTPVSRRGSLAHD